MNTIRFFQNLPGSWVINRSIPDYGHMQGEATFSQIGTETNKLRYHEQGQLTLEASKKTFACYRDYVYRYQGEQDAISIHFVEAGKTDRLFHMLQFPTDSDVSTAKGTHHCGQDIYRAVYESIDNDAFRIIYKVKGPHKDYESHTTFQRKPSSVPEEGTVVSPLLNKLA